MNQLTDYQFSQLTNQSECYIHTHPRETLDQLSAAQLQEATPVLVISGNTTLTAAQDFVDIDPAGATVTLTLPPAAKSKEYHATMVGTGRVVLTPDGTDTIIGEPSVTMHVIWTSLHVKSDNFGNWIIV